MTTHTPQQRIPAAAESIRLTLWQRSKARVRDRYGFDIEAPDALERAQRAVAEDPSSAETHLLLASVLATRGEAALAEGEARQALDLAPRLARAHTTLATILMQRGDREGALLAARNAAAVDMEDPSVLYNLGLAEWVCGQRKTAKAAFRHAIQVLDAERRPPEPQQRPHWWERIRHRG